MDGLNVELGTVEIRTSEELLQAFLNALRIQGRSENTIAHYNYVIKRLMKWSDIPIQDYKIDHLRDYLGYEKDRGISNGTLESNRQVFSAFFGWLHREGLILRDPVTNLGTIKVPKRIRHAYSDIDVEMMKQCVKHIRDKAIVCFLLSTGCRIGEMVQLNRDSIDISAQECTVIAKGNKEKVLYFDAETRVLLEQYLKQRTDSNEALFVHIRPPFGRIQPGGVRIMMTKIQSASGVEHIHPHKFRRTRATRLIKHGMPIEEVATILGHEKLDTTMKYIAMDKQDIKSAYQKYI